jgi:hypothetical protein
VLSSSGRPSGNRLDGRAVQDSLPARPSFFARLVTAPFGLEPVLWRRLGGFSGRTPYALTLAAALVFVLGTAVERARTQLLAHPDVMRLLGLGTVRTLQFLIEPVVPLVVFFTLLAVRRWRAIRRDAHLAVTRLSPTDAARLTFLPLVGGVALVVFPMVWLWMILNALQLRGSTFGLLEIVLIRLPPAFFHTFDAAIVTTIVTWCVTARRPTILRAFVAWVIVTGLLKGSTFLSQLAGGLLIGYVGRADFAAIMARITLPGLMRLAVEVVILVPLTWHLIRLWHRPRGG